MKGDSISIMSNVNYLDISEVIETFDPDETRTLIQAQLSLLDDDALEMMADNFKLLFTRYASLKEDQSNLNPDAFQEAEDRFFNICQIFIEEISTKYGFTIDEDFLDKQYANLPSIALPIYLFFVLDFRSNLFNSILTFINQNRDGIVSYFEDRRNKHDSITIVNRTAEDQDIALITSNIYDVIDWCMEQMSTSDLLDCMEKDYIAYGPIRTMYDDSVLNGEFIDAISDILKTNVALKARIGYDIICRLKGFEL